MPTTAGLHAVGEWVNGVKQVACTPVGRGPAVIHSLSKPGTLPFRILSLSWMNPTVPSPGCRTSPAPPHLACSSGAGAVRMATHGRVHVKPPLVDRFTHTPLVSSVRLKLIWA